MTIPFVKAHGARNDFLLTWRAQAPATPEQAASAICDRHTGAGADGWLLVERPPSQECDGAIHLYNSDGSESDLSGNGTRCAAAFLLEAGYGGETVRIRTGAGLKTLRLLAREGRSFSFEMHMGRALFDPEPGPRASTVLDVGNPQCAVFVDDFSLDWRGLGAAIERDPRFPRRTNVSFVRPVDRHTIEVRFWERGAGETMSSGTGSTGAAAAARARGLLESPAQVLTPAGPLAVRWETDDMFLTGPAEIVAQGEFYW